MNCTFLHHLLVSVPMRDWVFYVFFRLCSEVCRLQRQRCSTCRRWKRWKVMDRIAFKPRYIYEGPTFQTANHQNIHIHCSEILALLHSFMLGIVPPTRVFSSSSKQDGTGTDVNLGSCLDGIIVKHKNGRPLVLFR